MRAAEIFSENLGVVQALVKGEAKCTCANHNDADLWVWERNKVQEVIQE